MPNEPDNRSTFVIPSMEQPSHRIDRYKILQQIGEGGCGVVYVAEQEEPVRRRVALKVIKLGMDTRSVIARFEAERQALALMDHPNIAKVLDAGATETGRPFFVMELVRGVKITDYCDEAKLSTRERLDLFVLVCSAVQHAHQKGIIHRDLKPSNILVTINDGVPVPKVIDFGIAKATTGQQLTDKTLFTAYEQFIGTPAYMSPEQAVMTSLDIDTRSDIYALGVLLYELLTGRTPFDPKELLQAGFDEMRRTIREKEPERPSTRLSTMGEADLTSVASRRHCDAPKLIHSLRGDLDWIVMKALEKDRTRRFETANALAMDIQRYLSDEPVTARPPSSLYRFQKLARRNKGAFAAAAAVLVALVLGLITTQRQAARALRAEREQTELRMRAEAGLEAERKLRQNAELGKKYSEAGMLLSQGRFDDAEKLMMEVPPHPSAASIYSVLGRVQAARENWAEAKAHYTRVISLLSSDYTNTHDHAAYYNLATIVLQTGELGEYESRRDEIVRRFAQTTDPIAAERLVKISLAMPPRAGDLAVFGKMADVAIGAGPGHPAWTYFQFAKGLADYRQGLFDAASERLEQVAGKSGDTYRTIQARAVLAMAQHHLGRTNDARATLAQLNEFANRQFPKNGKGGGDAWDNWVIARVLLREATSVVEPGQTNASSR
jgi:eukaryotic-like serine/threonine-protein kinase